MLGSFPRRQHKEVLLSGAITEPSPPPLYPPPQKPDDVVDRSLNSIKKWCLARCSGPDEDELLGEALDADK